jgi:hypothetical protein
MQQRLLTGAAHFPGHPGEGRDAAAILAYFDDAGGDEFLKAGLQFGGEFHALNHMR